MTNLEAVKNGIVKSEQPVSLTQLIQKSAKELGKALPSHLSPERLVRIALTCIRLNPELSRCTPESFLGSLFVLAQMGLEPIAGQSYLLPFNNKRKVGSEWKTIKEVQAVIGYKGLISLFYRHENALSLDMQTVFENDNFSYQYGTDSTLVHKPALKNRGEVIGYYAVAKMKGGASIFRFMSKSDVLEHAKKHSKSYDGNNFQSFSPWAKEFDSMAMKTVLIQLAKLLPLSVELQKAISVDETSRTLRPGIDDTMDLVDVTNWEEVTEEPVPTPAPEPAKAAAPTTPKKETPKGDQEIPF